MLILLLAILAQDPDVMDPEPINARVFLRNGEVIDVGDIKVKGADPLSFVFKVGSDSFFVNILELNRMRKLDDRGKFELLFTSGELKTGVIRALSFEASPVKRQDKNVVVTGSLTQERVKLIKLNLYELDRIHFIGGNQLRACTEGHYEQYTPYPFCPVCGRKLLIGPYPDEFPERRQSLPAYHRIRLDPRSPSSRRND